MSAGLFTHACVLGVATLFGASLFACKDPPVDCGDSGMGIVTFPQNEQDDEPIRICVDLHLASRVDASDKDAGLDESYAVSKPGVYPWTNLTFKDASDACGRAGKFLCDWDTLALLIPTKGMSLGVAVTDETEITSVPRNGPETTIEPRLDPVNPYDMIIQGETGKPAYPETIGAPAVWAISPEKDDRYVDENAPYVVGSIANGKAISGYPYRAVVPKEDFKHPLLGFRCCVNAKMRTALIPLGDDPGRHRAEPDAEVPLAP